MSMTVDLNIPATAEERIARANRPKPEIMLLLTVARILRAKIRDDIYAAQEDDLEALNEALAPFDPAPDESVDEQEPE
jgi:hypothetical protein